ncbi:MAG: SOS response-associated peptidase family protein [Rhodococcus sp. (in: high G+C Gram-positive bacteria)]|uniref:SOS response-associated peptidase family protein n=1 Tax=Rhodococcus sp. TaxID=1831 RepID=UPI002ADB6A3D|nr:SOS response-associated peptidase family protein [Rhodococcus sp. (in: high G+C Gram-positive bacteria)]
MCYSAQVQADYRKYVTLFGATMGIREFYQVFYQRGLEAKIKIPKAMEAAFAHPQDDDERAIKALIDEYNEKQAASFEQDLFKQRKRLADAERVLQTKTTKKAQDDQRIATDKVRQLMGRHADLTRTELLDRDSRIFPGYYLPVMIWEDGQRVIKPMRYGCRPAGKPAFYDVKFPGTYNARRDNLQGFWRNQFGHTHGLIVVNAFFENVNRHKAEGRDLASGEKVENLVLEFRPRPTQDMLVACLWSKWTGPGEPDLLSMAAITDEPPAEVAAAGHDRCIIPIRPENIDAWLCPQPGGAAALFDILDDRERPYYEHRMAA